MKKKERFVLGILIVWSGLMILGELVEQWNGVWSVDLEGHLRKIDYLRDVNCVAASPDGQQLAVGREGRIDILTLDGRRVKTVAEIQGGCYKLVWNTEGIMGRIMGRGLDFYWIHVDPEQGQVRKMFTADEVDSIAPDGQWVSGVEFQKVVIREIATDQTLVVGEAASYFQSAWSPDSQHVAFVDKNTGLTIANRAGEIRVLHPDPQALPSRWSPDQRYLLVRYQHSLWVLDVETGAKVTHFQISKEHAYGDMEWHSDGQRFFYIEYLDDQEGMIIHLADRSGASRPIVHLKRTSILRPHWSPDGQSVLFSAVEAVKVVQ